MDIAGTGARRFGQHRIHHLNHRFARRERPQIVEGFGALTAEQIGAGDRAGDRAGHRAGHRVDRPARRGQDRRTDIAGPVGHHAHVGVEGALQRIPHRRRQRAIGGDQHRAARQLERQHRMLLQPSRRQSPRQRTGRRRPQITGIATHAGGFRVSGVPSSAPGERSSRRFFTRSRIASASASERTRYGVTKIASSVR